MKIAPSILSADFANLQRDIKLVEDAGADMLHIDVMDGHFVPNITLGPPVVKSLRKISKLIFDVHLMIERPESYIDEFIKSGADIITIHAESTYHVHRAIQMIKKQGIKAGVALNPSTPISLLENIIDDLDLVLIMSVNPGFGGQKLIPATFYKIEAVKSIINEKNLKTEIEVDGGIDVDNVKQIVRCGADIIVAGSAVYNSNNVYEAIKIMKERCD